MDPETTVKEEDSFNPTAVCEVMPGPALHNYQTDVVIKEEAPEEEEEPLRIEFVRATRMEPDVVIKEEVPEEEEEEPPRIEFIRATLLDVKEEEPEVDITDGQCPWCTRILSSPRGVGIHARTAHPDQYAAYQMRRGKVATKRRSGAKPLTPRSIRKPTKPLPCSPSTCVLCNRDCKNVPNLKSHERGKAHLKVAAAQLKAIAFC